ncbi:MAG: right-handed parallel beta-helix repeat-containing protein [Promethearchaeota archaeon]
MKLLQKKLQIYVIMGIIFTILLGGVSNITHPTSILLNPKCSTLIPHNSIEIQGDAELDAFCSGNGTNGQTWASAYRIENFSISMGIVQTGFGLLLNGTTRKVIIRNMSFDSLRNYIPAIYLFNSENIRIEDVMFSSFEYGIQVQNSNSVNITDVDIEKCNEGGIGVQNSQNITISNSNFHGSTLYRSVRVTSSYNVSIDLCSFHDITNDFTVISSTDTEMMHVTNSSFPSVYQKAIEVLNGNSSLIENNSISTTSYAPIRITNHKNFHISNNSLSGSSGAMLLLTNCENGIVDQNDMGTLGMQLDGINTNLNISNTNLVNGKGISYFENDIYLNEDIGDIGQVLINNVNNSRFAHIIVEDAGYTGIQMINSFNTTIDQCFINDTDDDNQYGIYISYSSNFTIQNSQLYENYIGISMRYSDLAILKNNSVVAINEYYGFYSIGLSNVILLDNIVSGYSKGMYLRNTENVTGYYNEFTACTFDFGSTTNLIFDDSNTRDGKPMYYYYGVSNQILDLSSIGELYIDNCQHLLILNALFEGTNDGITVANSLDIGIFNVTVSNSTNYLFHAWDTMNLTLMNSTFIFSDGYGLEFSNVTNLVIQNCLFSNITDYPLSFSDVNNVDFSQNWIVNSSGPIYFEEFENVNVTNNCYANNGTDWIEIYYDTGNETIYISNNLNQSFYDPNYFPSVSVDDIMEYMNIPINKDTNTSTSTTTTTSTSGTETTNNGNEFDWVEFFKIAGIIAGSLIGIALIVFVALKLKQKNMLNKKTQKKTS